MKTRILLVDRRTLQVAKSYAKGAEGNDAGDVVAFALDCLTGLLVAVHDGGRATDRPTAMNAADVLADFAAIVVERHGGPMVPEGSPMIEA